MADVAEYDEVDVLRNTEGGDSAGSWPVARDEYASSGNGIARRQSAKRYGAVADRQCARNCWVGPECHVEDFVVAGAYEAREADYLTPKQLDGKVCNRTTL